jgi:two-component system, cell cycle response regulator DivK
VVGDFRPRSVLIVDDVEDNRELYAIYFDYLGFVVDTAADGTTALDKALARRPDIIVLDFMLPGLDGWEICRRVRHDPRTKDVIIVALSGRTGKAVEREAMIAGCDAFHVKPCLPEDLAATINRLLVERSAKGA